MAQQLFIYAACNVSDLFCCVLDLRYIHTKQGGRGVLSSAKHSILMLKTDKEK